MKRMVIFIVIGAVLFAAGIGGGMFFGRSFGGGDSGAGDMSVAPPGPIIPAGEFTVNLAGPGNRLLSFNISLEILDAKVDEMIRTQNWLPRMRNEILLLAKDKVYEDLTRAEGVVQLGEQIRRTLNIILPNSEGEVPIVRVMFESFILQ